MNNSRRDLLRSGAATTLGMLSAGVGTASMQPPSGPVAPELWENLLGPNTSRRSANGSKLVHTADVAKLVPRMDNDVKVFELTAEVVQREFLPGWTFDVWGYNGSVPGPTIEADQGDRVRIVVENRLPESTSIHWHGLEVPNAMDGVPGVTQDPIRPGERFVYEFDLHQHGTFFYHSHMPMQEMMGMVGFFILHPARPYRPGVDKDFGLILQEWAILPNNTVPNSLSMEFNWLTLNGRAGPHTTPLIVRLGDRVRLRFVNLGMDHHPMHLHGHTWVTTGTEAGRIPTTARIPGNTELVGVAQARDVEFTASSPGDWILHCHLPHHMMNHMSSMVGPMRGVDHDMNSGAPMAAGMGISEGAALAESNAPTMGRAIGLGARPKRPVTHLPLRAHPAPSGQDSTRVPGYPQDHFMAMDDQVAKVETHGMRPGWSGGVMGMMTVVRVLEADLYDQVQELRARETAADASSGAAGQRRSR